MRVAIGADKAGSQLKDCVTKALRRLNCEVIDYGYHQHSEQKAHYSASYASSVSLGILDGIADRGVLICGTGVGISIAANKFRGIRAVACSDPITARPAREENGVQVVAFGASIIDCSTANRIVAAFINAEFKGALDAKYVMRFEMISAIEDGGLGSER